MFYNYKKLIAEIPDETHAAKFLQKVGIMHIERFCCGMKMYPEEKKIPEIRADTSKIIFSFLYVFLHNPFEKIKKM